jgi:hypothetical protein
LFEDELYAILRDRNKVGLVKVDIVYSAVSPDFAHVDVSLVDESIFEQDEALKIE